MMAAEDIRRLICVIANSNRVKGVNERGAAHYEGVFRGLIWALNGEDPGRIYIGGAKDWKAMFEMAGIGAEIKDGACLFDLEDKYLGNISV